MAKRSPHAETVGRWIMTRRSEKGLSQEQLAEQVQASMRTMTNVENGYSAVSQMSRARWERALGWPIGSLTLAYRYGVRPDADQEVPGKSILDEVGIPSRHAADPSVIDVLGAAKLSDRDKVRLLEVWWASRRQLESALAEADKGRRSAL